MLDPTVGLPLEPSPELSFNKFRPSSSLGKKKALAKGTRPSSESTLCFLTSTLWRSHPGEEKARRSGSPRK